VEDDQKLNIDVLYMIDSDMTPDAAGGKQFLDVSMDFLYKKLEPAVIAAPYVGGGPHNNVFVFHWKNANNGPNPNFTLMAYDREHAAIMKGVTEVAALPTGLIAYDMRVFDRLKQSDPGYFYYEMNTNRTEKQSTEDVTNTRDISLAWQDMPGAGCFCAWDCWANHNKVVPCEKPRLSSPYSVGESLYQAYESRRNTETPMLVDLNGDGRAMRPVEGFESAIPTVAEAVDKMRSGVVESELSEQALVDTARVVLNKFKDLSTGKQEEI